MVFAGVSTGLAMGIALVLAALTDRSLPARASIASC